MNETSNIVYECKVCEREFKENYFDVEQNKCILHCDKTEENEWYSVNMKKEWNLTKVNLFWQYIQYELDTLYQNSLTDENFHYKKYRFEKVYFPKFQVNTEYNPYAHNLDEMGTNFYSFNVFVSQDGEQTQEVNQIVETLKIVFLNCVFLDTANFRKYNFKKPIIFHGCTFTNKVLLNKKINSKLSFIECDFKNHILHLRHSTLEDNLEILKCKNMTTVNLEETNLLGKVKIQSCSIKEKANFYNTKFNDLADFYQTCFNTVVFERTDFNEIAIFSETTFNEDVDFKYTKFLGKAIFRDTVFKKKLDLRNTIFDDEALFLDITAKLNTHKAIKVSNRETARVIKNFLDTSNNIIEANKYYTLEMAEREKELKLLKNPIEWLIFKIHSISSNHSQDWLLSLLWIFNLTILYSIYGLKSYSYEGLLILTSTIFIVPFLLVNIPIYTKKILLLLPISITLFHQKIPIDTIATNINPFTKIGHDITFITLLFKISIAYLIYQFIVSIRKDTRRK